MKRMILITALLFGTILFSACDTMRVVRGTGDMSEENREVSGFNAVALDGVGTIFIEQGDRESLRIEAEENLLQYLETEVESQTLNLTIRRGINIVPTQGVFYYLTVQDLEEIEVNGLGNVDIIDLQTPKLALSINGGGEINAQTLTADELDVVINGLGNLDLGDGEVGDQSVQIDGGGNYNARNLASEMAEVAINGLGSATIWASDTLDVTIDGGGNVNYVGKPQVTQEINGLGEVGSIDE